MTPEALESLIDYRYERMLAAANTAEQQHWFQRMGRYVAQRTPQRVRERETEQGIAS